MFKKLRGCTLSDTKQMLVRATCLNYGILSCKAQNKITQLCIECAGEYYKALFRVLTTRQSIRSIAIDEHVSESQLYRFRLMFYERFFDVFFKERK